MSKIRSPIRWFGGKGMLVSKLLPYVPQHKYYCEVFGGSAALLFAKKPAKFEVYNDIDSGLVNFFRVLRDPEKFQEFYRKVCLTPYSREEYYFCRDTWESCEDDVERAYRWFVVARQSFGGRFNQGWAYSLKESNKSMSREASRWLSVIDKLPEFHDRIMRVQVEHLDWYDCINRYNDWRWEGFYYLDPPYYPDERRKKTYEHELTIEDHQKLVAWLLSECKVKVMLSGHDNEVYQQLERNGWRKICWDVACHVAGRTRQTQMLGSGATHRKNQRRQECIWINYDEQLRLPGM